MFAPSQGRQPRSAKNKQKDRQSIVTGPLLELTSLDTPVCVLPSLRGSPPLRRGWGAFSSPRGGREGVVSERPMSHAGRGGDGGQESCECGYYNLHRELDDFLRFHFEFVSW